VIVSSSDHSVYLWVTLARFLVSAARIGGQYGIALAVCLAAVVSLAFVLFARRRRASF
jgi:hypothetical protein